MSAPVLPGGPQLRMTIAGSQVDLNRLYARLDQVLTTEFPQVATVSMSIGVPPAPYPYPDRDRDEDRDERR